MITVTHRKWCAQQHDEDEVCEARLAGESRDDAMYVDLYSPTYESDPLGDEVSVSGCGNEICSLSPTIASKRLREYAAVLLNAADELDKTEGIVPAGDAR